MLCGTFLHPIYGVRTDRPRFAWSCAPSGGPAGGAGQRMPPRRGNDLSPPPAAQATLWCPSRPAISRRKALRYPSVREGCLCCRHCTAPLHVIQGGRYVRKNSKVRQHKVRHREAEQGAVRHRPCLIYQPERPRERIQRADLPPQVP